MLSEKTNDIVLQDRGNVCRYKTRVYGLCYCEGYKQCVQQTFSSVSVFKEKTTMYTAMSDFYRELFILKMSCFHSRDKVKYINSERKSGWQLCCLGNIIFLLDVTSKAIIIKLSTPNTHCKELQRRMSSRITSYMYMYKAL